jgi:hypothetical protein
MNTGNGQFITHHSALITSYFFPRLQFSGRKPGVRIRDSGFSSEPRRETLVTLTIYGNDEDGMVSEEFRKFIVHRS